MKQYVIYANEQINVIDDNIKKVIESIQDKTLILLEMNENKRYSDFQDKSYYDVLSEIESDTESIREFIWRRMDFEQDCRISENRQEALKEYLDNITE